MHRDQSRGKPKMEKNENRGGGFINIAEIGEYAIICIIGLGR